MPRGWFGVALLFLFLTLFAEMTAAQNSSPVSNFLTIDFGVDLDHTELKKYRSINAKEAQGKKNIDDDQNGFIDDVSGWNAISNNNQYFPPSALEPYLKHKEDITEVFQLYNQLQFATDKSTQDALDKALNKKHMVDMLAELLRTSHGTHVTGIALRVAKKTDETITEQQLKLVSLNAIQRADDSEAGVEMTAKSKLSSLFKPRTLQNDKTTKDPDDTLTPPPSRSPFDSEEEVDLLISDSAKDAPDFTKIVSEYIKARKIWVANLSLGRSILDVTNSVDVAWSNYLLENNLPETTKRSVEQEKNFQKAIKELYFVFQNMWAQIFKQNPGTLFVIAAGNNGSKDINAGNLEVYPMAPADLSETLPNVISVAASDSKGVLADFSCYGVKKVNLAAPGKNITSITPNNMKLVMSGTSQAAPLVAGTAIIIRNINRNLTPWQARQILEKTGLPKQSLAGKTSSGNLLDSGTARRAAELSKTLSLSAAIQKAVQERDGKNQQIKSILFSFQDYIENQSANDTTRLGEVSRTHPLIRKLIAMTQANLY